MASILRALHGSWLSIQRSTTRRRPPVDPFGPDRSAIASIVPRPPRRLVDSAARQSGRVMAWRLGDASLTSPFIVHGLALVWTLLVRLPPRHMDGLDDAFYVEAARL